jgi:hypothetical protein
MLGGFRICGARLPRRNNDRTPAIEVDNSKIHVALTIVEGNLMRS